MMNIPATLVSAATVLAICGCTTAAPKPGFGADGAVAAGLDEQMAAQSVAQIARLHPPAHTALNIMQATPDAYGTALVAELRLKGFAICECAPISPPVVHQPWHKGMTYTAPLPSAPAPSPLQGGLELRYAVDALSNTDLYRVTVIVGAESISRVFVKNDDGFTPASAWIHKE